MILHNAHVALYYRFLCWLAERNRQPMAQLVYHTAAMMEIDPQWRPDHL